MWGNVSLENQRPEIAGAASESCYSPHAAPLFKNPQKFPIFHKPQTKPLVPNINTRYKSKI